MPELPEGEQMSAKYPVITICGSMRYYHQMLTHALGLTRSGHIVVMPYDTSYQDGTTTDETKRMLDDMHTHKIDMADQVHVIGEHIGESTRNEIRYSKGKGVPIRYFDGDLVPLRAEI
jgi:hypothetical protein